MSTNSLIRNADGYAAAFQAADITSKPMRYAILRWLKLYYGEGDDKKTDPSQRIAYTIVRKLTKTVFAEYAATSSDQFVAGVLRELDKKRNDAMQMALIGGEALLKPVIAADGFRFLVIPRHNVLVFGRDADGTMTDGGTTETTTKGTMYYTLLERRTVDANGYLTIRNKLYRSYSADSLGQETKLTDLPQYEKLPEEYTFAKPVGSIGLIPLKTPMANCVDGSPDRVAVYAAAAGLIRNIDRNEEQLSREFENGASRVIVSADMLKKDHHGNPLLEDDVFVGLDEDLDTTGITIFSPGLREASFLARKQEYLRNVENVIGLKRGLLSEVEAAERTATEITSSAGEYNLTVIDFQNMWEKMVRDAVQTCGTLGQLYQISGAHEVADDAVTIDWGNGILYDESKTWEDYKGMVATGLLKPEIALGWRFGMPTETEQALAAIREKYMPAKIEEDI